MAWMAQPTKTGRRVERGFTLAALLVILSVMMIMIAYTVPRQWSMVMKRDREQQTLFVMKQYARAIDEFSRKNNNTFPVSIDQLKQARNPRFLRGPKSEYVDPLTGKVDWLIIPQSAQGATNPPIATQPGQTVPNPGFVANPQVQPAPPVQTAPTPGSGPNPQAPPTSIPGVPMKDYAGGPFIGVRPPATGDSLITVNGAQKYEQWSYTVIDYRNDRNALYNAAMKIWQ